MIIKYLYIYIYILYIFFDFISSENIYSLQKNNNNSYFKTYPNNNDQFNKSKQRYLHQVELINRLRKYYQNLRANNQYDLNYNNLYKNSTIVKNNNSIALPIKNIEITTNLPEPFSQPSISNRINSNIKNKNKHYIRYKNNTPVVGILMQKLKYKIANHFNNKYHSYIAASYVKFIEGGGARVVPIYTNQKEEYYKNILKEINGVLLPGGGETFYRKNGYAEAGMYIYKYAKILNDNNDYFPVLGICLGFELMTYLEANKFEHRINCESIHTSLNLNFSPQFKSSLLYKNIPNSLMNIMSMRNVTLNNHKYCITTESLNYANISDKFKILTTNFDKNNIQFISSLEHTNYPFFGLQFHPEKNIYEWSHISIPHSYEAISVSQYFTNFFINECRKSQHIFSENSKLIYNYPIFYSNKFRSSHTQLYFF